MGFERRERAPCSHCVLLCSRFGFAQRAGRQRVPGAMTVSSAPDRSVAPELLEVLVFDDFIPDELLASVRDLTQRPIWAYGWKSVAKRDRFAFWHAHFAGGDENAIEDCAAELEVRPSLAPIAELWKHLSESILADHVLVRAYANAHTYGVEGTLHTDSKDPDYYSTILYAHDTWKFNWAGETAFVCRDSDEVVRSVHPKPGRLIVFKGATHHVARSPSRECPALRISVVFKTRRAVSDPFSRDAVKATK